MKMITQLRLMSQFWLWLTIGLATQYVTAGVDHTSNNVTGSSVVDRHPVLPTWLAFKAYNSIRPNAANYFPQAAPIISVSVQSLTFLNSTQLPGSNSKTYVVSATGLTTSDFRVTAPSPFVVSAQNAGAYPGGITLPVNSDGTLSPTTITVSLLSSSPGTFSGSISNSSGETTTTVAVSGTTVSPSLSLSTMALNAFSTTTGIASAIQTYTITALSQTGGVVSAPTGVEIRTGNTTFGSSLTLPSSLSTITIPVDVRLTGGAAGQVSGVITHKLNNSSNQSIISLPVSGTVVNLNAPTITVTPSSLTIVDYSEYPGSFPASYTVSASGLTTDLELVAPPYYLLTANGKSGPSLLIPAANGVVPPTSVSVILLSSSAGQFSGTIVNWSGSTTATVGVSGTALAQSVTVTPTSLGNFSTTLGNPSANQSYTVTTQGGLPVYVSAPAGFELRTGSDPFSSSLLIGSSRSVVRTQIDVRLTGSSPGPVAGTITQKTYFHSSQGVYPVAVSGIVSGSMAVQVLHRDVDNYANNNAIQPVLQVVNQGSSSLPLSGLTLRYYLTAENFAPLTNLFVFYAQLGASNVSMRYVTLAQPRQGALGYIEYSFTPGAGNLAPGANTGSIQTYIAKSNYTGFNELDDYSYATVRDRLLVNPRITAYYNGVLIAGQEPAFVTPRGYLVPYTESKNGPSATQIGTYLDVRNEGNLPINYRDITLRYYFTSDSPEPLKFELDYTTLGTGTVRGQFVKINPPLVTADTYLELSFADIGQLMPLSSTGLIRYHVSKLNGARFDQRNDYSYQEQPANLSSNARMAIYVGNQRYWGNDPGAGARLAFQPEGTSEFYVQLLGNPVQNNTLTFTVEGTSEPLQMQLTNAQGRVISQQQLRGNSSKQHHQVSLENHGTGIYLLQISTPTQQQRIKVMKLE